MPSVPNQIFSTLIRDLYDVSFMGNIHQPHYFERMITIALAVASPRPSVTWKENLSAVTAAFRLGTGTPPEARCSG